MKLVLDYSASQDLLRRVRLTPFPAVVIDAAKPISESLGLRYPVVVKIDDPDLPHRSDVGGVILNCRTVADANAARQQILENVARNVSGHSVKRIVVQEQAPKGVEIHVGVFNDPHFGPVVAVGMGGVFVELFGSHAFRLPPLTAEVAIEAIRQAIPKRIIEGTRGNESLNVPALVDVIQKVSKLALLDSPRLIELDLNPVIVHASGVALVDCLAVISGTGDPTGANAGKPVGLGKRELEFKRPSE